MTVYQGWQGVPYLPPEKVSKKEIAQSFDVSVFMFVFVLSAIAMVILGFAHYADRRNPTRELAGYKIKKAKVPAYVLTSRENMELWLKIHYGKAEKWQIDLLEGLRDARISAFRRSNVGKGPVGLEMMLKVKDDDDQAT